MAIKKTNVKAVGDYYRMLREARNLLQKDVAQDLKISVKHYNQIERGLIAGSFVMVVKIFEYYDCKVEITMPKLKLTLGSTIK